MKKRYLAYLIILIAIGNGMLAQIPTCKADGDDLYRFYLMSNQEGEDDDDEEDPYPPVINCPRPY